MVDKITVVNHKNNWFYSAFVWEDLSIRKSNQIEARLEYN